MNHICYYWSLLCISIVFQKGWNYIYGIWRYKVLTMILVIMPAIKMNVPTFNLNTVGEVGYQIIVRIISTYSRMSVTVKKLLMLCYNMATGIWISFAWTWPDLFTIPFRRMICRYLFCNNYAICDIAFFCKCLYGPRFVPHIWRNIWCLVTEN